MNMNLPYCGNRFGGRPEPEPRDVKTELMEPDTEEEYLERKADLGRVDAVIKALWLVHHHMGRMSEFSRDELDGCLPNIPYLDLPDDIQGAVECRRELEAGVQAWERKYD